MDSDRIVDIFIITAAIAILVARIAGWITWPWIWITAIIWIPFAIGLALLVSLIFILIIIAAINKIKEINK